MRCFSVFFSIFAIRNKDMSNPLIVMLIMAGVVKFSNPMYNPEAVNNVLNQIAELTFKGSIFIERSDKSVSSISYACSVKSEVVRIADTIFRDAVDVVRVSIPALNIVLYR